MIRPSLVGLVLLGLVAGCGTMNVPKKEPSLAEIILHLEYRGGGDAPIIFLMTFYREGEVRLHAARRKTYWSRLTPPDHHDLNDLLESKEFHKELELLKAKGYRFACCDYEETGIFLSPEAEPVSLRADQEISELPRVAELARLVDGFGREYFGRHYTIHLRGASPFGVEK